jgi:hypothetical protein
LSVRIKQITQFTKELAMDSTRSALFAFSLAILFAGPASADTLTMDSPQSVSRTATPERGMTMDAVRARFGNPVKEYPAVPAKGDRLHPPITRWDYNGYAVYFENNIVVHSVVTPPEAR